MRECGHYWVAFTSPENWQVAWWDGALWYLTGVAPGFKDNSLARIDERLIKRGDVVFSEEDCAVLLRAIEKPPKPSERLKELMARQPPRSAT